MRAEGFVPQRRIGRGGSVSRRDHNQAYRRPHPTPLSGGTNYKEATTSNASCSSGERGLGERRFSQRSGLSPRISQSKQSLRKGAREGGGFSTEKPPPSQKNFIRGIDKMGDKD